MGRDPQRTRRALLFQQSGKFSSSDLGQTGITVTEKPHVLRQVELDSASKRGEALTDLFAERNLNLPKTVAQTPRPEASSQSMSKALDSALKSEMARDIYPSMNFFRTEEKQGKPSFSLCSGLAPVQELRQPEQGRRGGGLQGRAPRGRRDCDLEVGGRQPRGHERPPSQGAQGNQRAQAGIQRLRERNQNPRAQRVSI